MTVLTVGVVAVALAFFSALAFGPGERARQTPALVFSAPALPTMPRPTFNSKPVPDRTLVLPRDIATVTYRITLEGQTGLVSNESLATTYRLRTGGVVTVASLSVAETLPYPSPAPGAPPVRVRGRDANWIFTDNGTSAIRWIENGVAFEMSSRTLNVAQLADLANKLR